ncbi:hypothetical protein ACLB2K_070734 [Fragaria x ananassa]
MSFRDLESGLPPPQHQRQSLYLKNSNSNSKSNFYDKNKEEAEQEPSRAVAAGIFQYQTAVASFYRLVNSLGTPKDTLVLRDNLHKTRTHIQQLGKDIHAKLREASDIDHNAQVSVVKKIADAKLTKNFQAALKDFQKAQRLAAERETSYAPFVPKQHVPSSYSPQEQEMSSARSSQQQALLLEERQEVLLSDNEIAFNEAIIEEREQGIQEIQQQISEVNEIFKDLAVLVQDQGALIDDFSSNIENSHSATAQAASQLLKASKLQKSNSSLTCLLLVIFGIILMIVIIVVVA